MTCSVYLLHDPLDDALRYVGISVDPEQRLRAHIALARSVKDGAWRDHGPKADWIRGLLAAGLEPRMTVIATFPTTDEATQLERLLIAKHRGTVFNRSPGGETGRPVAAPFFPRDRSDAVGAAFLGHDLDPLLDAIEDAYAAKTGGLSTGWIAEHFGLRGLLVYALGCLHPRTWRRFGEDAIWEAFARVRGQVAPA